MLRSAAEVLVEAGEARDGWPPARPSPTVPHLLHVFPGFDLGGAQVRFCALVEALGGAYRHSVISLSDTYAARALLGPDAPVTFLDPPVARANPLQRLSAIRAELDRLHPDVLLTYNWGAMEFALANFGQRPHVHHEDGFGPDEAVRQLRRRVWTRRLALARSHVVVPSQTLLELATGHWRLSSARVRYIPNGVMPRPDVPPSHEQLRLDVPRGRVRIIWVGALRPEKNVIRLLHAFAPLRDRATLIVVGDGPERPAVVAAAAKLGLGDSLQLLGVRADSRELLAMCDILALSSETEQMPLVVLEAMEAGLPVASVDVGDVRRMLACENHAYVTPLDPEPLGQALAQLAADPAIRAQVGAANRARARSLYTLPTMVRSYADLFRDALADHGSDRRHG